MADDLRWMQLALEEAKKAYAKREVPVGAVIILKDQVIGRGHNLVESLQDPLAHAEMMAISAAATSLASWRLDEAVLYVTLEPCIMCTGAILFSRISRVVFATTDARYGACGSALQLANHEKLDVHTQVSSGVLQDESIALIREFFGRLRSAKSG
jgi:tRNA(adenine34) deaminase